MEQQLFPRELPAAWLEVIFTAFSVLGVGSFRGGVGGRHGALGSVCSVRSGSCRSQLMEDARRDSGPVGWLTNEPCETVVNTAQEAERGGKTAFLGAPLLPWIGTTLDESSLSHRFRSFRSCNLPAQQSPAVCT